MERLILTDSQWDKIAPHCLGKITDRGRTGTNNRLFVEAVLWIARTGSPWRDLPVEFGKWNTILKDIETGLKLVYLKKYLLLSMMLPIWNMP